MAKARFQARSRAALGGCRDKVSRSTKGGEIGSTSGCGEEVSGGSKDGVSCDTMGYESVMGDGSEECGTVGAGKHGEQEHCAAKAHFKKR